MKPLVAVTFVLFLSVYFASSQIYRAFDHSHANFIQDPFLLLVGENYNSLPSTIPSTEVESLISHISGLLPLHSSLRENFPTVSLFNRPKANVMFLLEGLGSDYLSGKHLKHPLRVLKSSENEKTKLIPIKHDDEVSSLSLLTTLVTGSPVEKHGILSKFWHNSEGEVQHAFSGIENEPFEATLADVLLQTSEGKALLLSACAERAISSALSPRRSLLDAHSGQNVVSLSWNEQGFVGSSSTPMSSLLSLTSEKIFQLFDEYTPLLFSGSGIEVSYKKDEKIFTVSVSGDMSETFDMDRREEFLLFVELFSHFHVVSQLSKSPLLNELVSDETPDLLSFAFSSLQDLTRNGVYSSKTRAAVYLIDSAVYKMVEKLNLVYSGRTAIEVVSLGSSLSGLDLPYSGKYVLQSYGNDSSNGTDGGDITDEDVAIYHTCLWTGIGLFLAITGAVYTLFYMHVHQDPLIFRPTFK